eukprot:NODE_5199_length_717_cov_24.279661_g5176_i0.p1 GENE.NODE_5199_length_717_cov_24.279661_g5176_i0~~NODE_5199_length_717_cov_24.279661_g5176_i0.p1  ORF type:complete len:215 (-),score=25.48 NODE_5199_length_717_cov_24.279661_g5176_i0:72-635(-)
MEPLEPTSAPQPLMHWESGRSPPWAGQDPASPVTAPQPRSQHQYAQQLPTAATHPWSGTVGDGLHANDTVPMMPETSPTLQAQLWHRSRPSTRESDAYEPPSATMWGSRAPPGPLPSVQDVLMPTAPPRSQLSRTAATPLSDNRPGVWPQPVISTAESMPMSSYQGGQMSRQSSSMPSVSSRPRRFQ